MENCDIFFLDISADELNKRLPVRKKAIKPLYYNFYDAKPSNHYGIFELENTTLVRKEDNGFYRLYICSSDSEELSSCLLALKESIYAINIPSKKDISYWREILEKSGFAYYARYDRYYNTQIEKRESDVGVIATNEDADGILNLIYNGEFSVYTDYLPTRKEIIDMISNRQVIINKRNDKVLGVIIYTIEGRKCYINLWIDYSGEGLFLLFDVYNIMVEKGLKYAYFWANSTNKKVIKIHKLTGATIDGVSDYTFLKNK